MAIGTISSPASWTYGTIAPAAWFTNVQDMINHLYLVNTGRKYYFMEEFDHFAPGGGTIADSSGQISKFYLTVAAMGKFWVDLRSYGETVPALSADTGGLLFLGATNGGDQVDAYLSAGELGIGTKDFVFRMRCRINQRTKLAATNNASRGFQISLFKDATNHISLIAGSDQNNYQLQIDGTTNHDLGVAANTTFATIEIVRASSVLSVYMNRSTTAAYSVANSTSLLDRSPWINLHTIVNSVTTPETMAEIDFVSVEFTRE